MSNETEHEVPLHAVGIEDYALVGDCETGALVSRNGSIDWLCWPTFSSGACFAALLGTADHGFWKIAPAESYTVSRQYEPDTLVLETTFTAPHGEVVLLDFMPPRGRCSYVIRRLQCTRGSVDLRMDLAIRFDYGRTIPWVTSIEGGMRAVSGPHMVVFRSSTPSRGEGMATVSDFCLREGEQADFTLTYLPSVSQEASVNHEANSMGNDSLRPLEPINVDFALQQTREFWSEWNRRGTHSSRYSEAVQRSLMTLKALTYRPSGGIVAAVTTSLPEKIGGKRNWDYRFCWLRDTAFTLLVLLHAGYHEEAEAWRRWLLRAIAGAPEQIQSIYGICGERELIEWPATWLPGYEYSSPVNIGNGAAGQFQLDVFGEIASALSRSPGASEDIRVSAASLQVHLIDHVCKVWPEPDQGIWEIRGEPRHFTHSKVMAWVALDRAIRHYEQYNGGGDIERWKLNRQLLHNEVCQRGFNHDLNAFTQSYGSKELDASCLLLALTGFLPPEDPRIVGTIDAIQKYLLEDGLVLRYNTSTNIDGLPPGEGVFLVCSFWLVSNLWLIGRHDEAVALFERLLALRNDVGLLSEEYDPVARRMLGNFPQGLSHISLAHAAFTITGSWRPQAASEGS